MRSERPWYRNATGRHYHEAGPEWTRTGMSSCGRHIARAGFVARADELLKRNLRTCYDCLVKATRYE
jgi:hypothetical protein